MAKKRQGLLSRMIIGTEKSEGYARASLPSNRWDLFFDVFKGSYKKLIGVNLLMLMFFLPLFVLLFLRYNATLTSGTMCPYSQVFGVGYQSTNSFVGYAETLATEFNLILFAFLPLAVLIASIGVAGGAYVIRNIVWTEGIFVSNDFWKGIKQNYKELLLTAMFYSIIVYSTILSVSFANQAIALQTAPTWLMLTCKIGALIMLGFFTVVMLHMVTMGVTYKLSFPKLAKNAFIFTIGLLPQNVFFGVIALAPFILFVLSGKLGMLVIIISAILIAFIGISFALLVWTDYSHWMYDKFINDKIEGAQKNRGIYVKVKEDDSEALARHSAMMSSPVRCSLNSRPIKPITDDELTIAELPTSFNRSDIERLNESKRVLIEDNERYIEEHKNEEQYKVVQVVKEESPEDKKKAKRIEQARKELEKRRKK